MGLKSHLQNVQIEQSTCFRSEANNSPVYFVTSGKYKGLLYKLGGKWQLTVNAENSYYPTARQAIYGFTQINNLNADLI